MKTQTTAQPETIFDRELRPLVEREVMSNPAPAIPATDHARYRTDEGIQDGTNRTTSGAIGQP